MDRNKQCVSTHVQLSIKGPQRHTTAPHAQSLDIHSRSSIKNNTFNCSPNDYGGSNNNNNNNSFRAEPAAAGLRAQALVRFFYQRNQPPPHHTRGGNYRCGSEYEGRL